MLPKEKISDINTVGMLNAYKAYFVTKKFWLLAYCLVGFVLANYLLNNMDDIKQKYPTLSILLIPVYFILASAFIGLLNIIFTPLFGFVILPMASAIFKELSKWTNSISNDIQDNK